MSSQTDVEKLLIELVKIPSESGNEKVLGEFIVQRLEKKFKVERQFTSNGNFNVLAYKGKPKILFNAHLDTVPGQLEVKQDEKYIYGRGACDTKSSVACMIIAAEELVDSGKDIALLFDVGEEKDFSGIKKALENFPETVKFSVIGEPTSQKMIVGQKGIIEFKLTCSGKRAHSSMPEQGVNAIEKLIDDLDILRGLKFPEDKNLGKTLLNIAKVEGGITGNVIPDNASAKISMRCATSAMGVRDMIKKNLKNSIFEETLCLDSCFNEDAAKLAKSLGVKGVTVSYFTEMYFLSQKTKSFVLGAGNIEDAHSNTEKVEKKELGKSIELYKKIVDLLMKNGN